MYFSRNRDPKELLKAKKNGPNFESTNQNHITTTSSSTTSLTTKKPVTGKLHDTLARERADRNAIVSCAGSRMNRFGGVFVVPSSVSSSKISSDSSSLTTNNNNTKGQPSSVSQIIRNPIALLNPEVARPNVQKKRTRGSTTFSKDSNSITKSSSFMSSAGVVLEQKALYVLSEFLETFLSSGFR